MKIEGTTHYLHSLKHHLQVYYDLGILAFGYRELSYNPDTRTLSIRATKETPFVHDGNPIKTTWNGLLIGLPDAAPEPSTYSKTYIPGIMLSALYRYGQEVGVTRAQADKMYYRLLKRVHFPFALIYYLVIRIFGRKFWGK